MYLHRCMIRKTCMSLTTALENSHQDKSLDLFDQENYTDMALIPILYRFYGGFVIYHFQIKPILQPLLALFYHVNTICFFIVFLRTLHS